MSKLEEIYAGQFSWSWAYALHNNYPLCLHTSTASMQSNPLYDVKGFFVHGKMILEKYLL